jgi:hypothetical protein
MNYLPRLASNLDPPDLCVLSSQDSRCEPPTPARLCYCSYFTDEKIEARLDPKVPGPVRGMTEI